jgi:hypothetical protein
MIGLGADKLLDEAVDIQNGSALGARIVDTCSELFVRDTALGIGWTESVTSQSDDPPQHSARPQPAQPSVDIVLPELSPR